jgi:hypothetical protein
VASWKGLGVEKIIVVEGPKRSGKTTSIREAARILGADITNKVADLQMIVRLRLGRDNCLVGIGSAGDDAEAIARNIDLFYCNELDYTIFACSTPRKGMPLLEAFATLHGLKLIKVHTTKANPPTPAQMQAQVSQTANEIASHILGGG